MRLFHLSIAYLTLLFAAIAVVFLLPGATGRRAGARPCAHAVDGAPLLRLPALAGTYSGRR